MSDNMAAKIELIRDPMPGHPYPWQFTITHRGVLHVFGGVPNQCKTASQALRRAQTRLKWMDEGTYSKRYKVCTSAATCSKNEET